MPNSGPIFKAKDVSDLQANTGCPKKFVPLLYVTVMWCDWNW